MVGEWVLVFTGVLLLLFQAMADMAVFKGEMGRTRAEVKRHAFLFLSCQRCFVSSQL